MKSKPDSADKAARALFERFDCFSEAFTSSREIIIGEIAKTYSAAEKRGFKRAVKLLREKNWLASEWLEEQERK